MKRVIRILLIVFIINISFNPIVLCYGKTETITTREKLLAAIEESKNIQEQLYKNGKSAYSKKLDKEDLTLVKNDVRAELNKIVKIVTELEVIANDKNVPNNDRRSAVIIVIGFGYYRIANEELERYVIQKDVDRAYENLNQYFNARNSGFSTLNWMEQVLKKQE